MIKLFLNNNFPYTIVIVWNAVLYRQRNPQKMYFSLNFERKDLSNIFLVCYKHITNKNILPGKTEIGIVFNFTKVYYSSNKT